MSFKKTLRDLKEERDMVAYNARVTEPMYRVVAEFEGSVKKYPLIKGGTPDPYTDK
jgi:hypothetical protein